MNTRHDPRTIKTSAVIVVVASVSVGGLGAFFFGLWGVLGAGLGGLGTVHILMFGVNFAIIGAASGVSLVGLCALIARAELSRHFSYPFTITLGGVLGLVTVGFLESWAGRSEERLFLIEGIGFATIILGAVAGKTLATRIRAYGGPSRAWAAITAIVILPAGGVFNYWLMGGRIFGDEEVWFFLVATLLSSVVGGLLGTVGGAISRSAS